VSRTSNISMPVLFIYLLVLSGSVWAADAPSDLILKNPFDNMIGVHFKAEGDRAYKKKKYVTALKHYKKAYQHAPENHRITYKLGKAHLHLGNEAEAERFFGETVELNARNVDAHENLAELLTRPGSSLKRLKRAERHIQISRSVRGEHPDLVLMEARVQALVGKVEKARTLYLRLEQLDALDDEVRFEIGRFFEGMGELVEALNWYRTVYEDPTIRLEVQARIQNIEQHRNNYCNTVLQNPALTGDSLDLLERARQSRNEGQLEAAEVALTDALRSSGGAPQIYGQLGQVLHEMGRHTDAELAYLRSLSLQSDNPIVHVRIANLYRTWPNQPRLDEALRHLERALTLRPDWHGVHLRLARNYPAVGKPELALFHVEKFLALPDTSKKHNEALELRETLTRTIAQKDSRTDPTFQPDGLTPEVANALTRARALHDIGRTNQAIRTLLSLSTDHQSVHTTLGELYASEGNLKDAMQQYELALKQGDISGQALHRLALIYEQSGQMAKARKTFRAAHDATHPLGIFHIRRLDMILSCLPLNQKATGLLEVFSDLGRIAQLNRCRDHSSAFLNSAVDWSKHERWREKAQSFHTSAGLRLRNLMVFGVLAVLLLLLLILTLYRRRFGGGTLRDLIEQHPETGPEVQQILAAIRHEVLKHNTMMLTGLVTVLEQNDDSFESISNTRLALFGTGRDDGVSDKLNAYVEQLQQIGRSHGMRLNLLHNDPAISALVRGMNTLKHVQPLFEPKMLESTSNRKRLKRSLEEATRLLNTEGYEAVRSLLDEIRVLKIDSDYLESLYSLTIREPAFSEVNFSPIDMDIQITLPCWCLIPRHSFGVIMTNLIRNAIESSIRQKHTVIQVGIGVNCTIDPITAIERVCIEVRDRSPKKLTVEQIRNRTVEEGLGLAASLATRYEGTLDVRDESSDWCKAVVLELPRTYPNTEDES